MRVGTAAPGRRQRPGTSLHARSTLQYVVQRAVKARGAEEGFENRRKVAMNRALHQVPKIAFLAPSPGRCTPAPVLRACVLPFPTTENLNPRCKRHQRVVSPLPNAHMDGIVHVTLAFVARVFAPSRTSLAFALRSLYILLHVERCEAPNGCAPCGGGPQTTPYSLPCHCLVAALSLPCHEYLPAPVLTCPQLVMCVVCRSSVLCKHAQVAACLDSGRGRACSRSLDADWTPPGCCLDADWTPVGHPTVPCSHKGGTVPTPCPS